MVHVPECAAWTWDARPYPFFPALTDVWTDGANWRLGHWLTGRLGAVSLAALVRHLCLRAGLPEARIDVTGLWGAVEGYAVTALESPRASITTLSRHFGFDAVETEGVIRFIMRGRASVATLAPDDLVAGREGDVLELTRGQETELPQALKWQVARADEDFEPALDKLQALRDRLGKPLIVRSAYRGPEHNRAVGGAPRSKHLDGAAFDIAMANHDPVAFEAAAREVGFLGFGFYPRSGFMHVDLGPARQWGERFPVRATAFAAETPPVREVLADSRTMKGGGAAGVATLGAAGVEVAQQVLAETQSAVLPLVPYLDTLRWMFIAVALGGIAVTIYARLDDWRRGRR